MLTRIAAVAAMALAAACAPVENDRAGTLASSDRECFFASQVSGFTHAGDNRILVSTGPRDRYLFETFGPCPDLDYSEAIGFDTNGPSTICRGLDVTLVVPSTIGPRRCPVGMIRKLTEAELDAR